MAYTLNGIGTTFYGQRDFRPDGTHITTEWFTIFYFPIIPLCSLRVRYRGPGKSRWQLGFGSADSYAVYEKSFPNWKQVLCTYGYVSFMAAWGYFVGASVASHYPRAFEEEIGVLLVAIICLIPFPTPWVLRHFAQRRMNY